MPALRGNWACVNPPASRSAANDRVEASSRPPTRSTVDLLNAWKAPPTVTDRPGDPQSPKHVSALCDAQTRFARKLGMRQIRLLAGPRLTIGSKRNYAELAPGFPFVAHMEEWLSRGRG